MVTIDLRGPDGNAWRLMALVRVWGKQLGVDTSAVTEDMRSGDYNHLLEVMRAWAEEHWIDLELIEAVIEAEGDEDG